MRTPVPCLHNPTIAPPASAATLQPAPRYQQISEDRFRLPYNRQSSWKRSPWQACPKTAHGARLAPRKDADVNAPSKAFPYHVVTFPCSSLGRGANNQNGNLRWHLPLAVRPPPPPP